MGYSIDELDIYKLSSDFSNKIWLEISNWNYLAIDTVGKQLIRSADSISANIAEGHGRYFFKENLKFCYYSRGSLIETKSWVEKAEKRKLISEELYNNYIEELKIIHIKLNSYIKFLRKQNQKISKNKKPINK